MASSTASFSWLRSTFSAAQQIDNRSKRTRYSHAVHLLSVGFVEVRMGVEPECQQIMLLRRNDFGTVMWSFDGMRSKSS
jgi:hypothetical protein